MKNWHIVTCEYPPQVGGVSDYTRLLARELRNAGDEVHVWAPAFEAPEEEGIHRTLGDFGARDLEHTGNLLDRYPKPRTLLLQWVPHGYGKRGINLKFSRWIAARARQGDTLYVMVHEPYLHPEQRFWKHRFVSLMQRRMALHLLHAAGRVFISIPGWEARLTELASPLLQFEWLPTPATIDAAADMDAVPRIRRRYGKDAFVLGHLGTYSPAMRAILQPALLRVLEENPHVHTLLLGSNSDLFASELRTMATSLADRIHGAGLLTEFEMAKHIAACDLALQPYPDGLSSRRSSLMNLLSRGIPIISNVGHLTEALWGESKAVALTSTIEAHQLASLCRVLISDAQERIRLGRAARDLYLSRFDWPHVISTLRSSSAVARSAAARTSSNGFDDQGKLE